MSKHSFQQSKYIHILKKINWQNSIWSNGLPAEVLPASGSQTETPLSPFPKRALSAPPGVRPALPSSEEAEQDSTQNSGGRWSGIPHI